MWSSMKITLYPTELALCCQKKVVCQLKLLKIREPEIKSPTLKCLNTIISAIDLNLGVQTIVHLLTLCPTETYIFAPSII